MNTTIELVLELVGGVIFLLAAGWTLARISGYDEYYDKMLYDDDDDEVKSQTIKKNTKIKYDNDEANHIIITHKKMWYGDEITDRIIKKTHKNAV